MNTHWRRRKQQITKDGASAFVNTGDLSIEHSTFHAQMFGDPLSEFGKASEDVSIS
jgi:hypothetical protein